MTRADAPRPPEARPRGLDAWWARHRTALLSIGIVLMALALVPRWAHELDRLLLEEGAGSARPRDAPLGGRRLVRR